MWSNISNKKFNKEDLEFDKENIKVRFGKPSLGLWCSEKTNPADYGYETEWHDFSKYIYMDPKNILKHYVTEKNTTFVIDVIPKETTKTITVTELKDCFDNKMSKTEIIRALNLKNTENLVLSINSKADHDKIDEVFSTFTGYRKLDNGFWRYVADNFVGCAIERNFFEETDRINDLHGIVEIPSFIAFTDKGFDFKETEKILFFENINMWDDTHPYNEFINKIIIKEELMNLTGEFEVPKHLTNIITQKNMTDVYKLMRKNDLVKQYDDDIDMFYDEGKIEVVHRFLKENYNVNMLSEDTLGYVDIENNLIYDENFEVLTPNNVIKFEQKTEQAEENPHHLSVE
jgi:hypothetical protein